MNYTDIDANFTLISQEENETKWLELRRSGIGGSDAGAILGLNKYASPLTVFMQKKGVKGFEGNNATKWGHILEDPIRQETAKEFGVKIERVEGMYTSNSHPIMNANIDGLIELEENQVLIVNGKELKNPLIGHEIKTSANGEGFTEEEIPDSYYAQVQHYMAVTGLDNFVLTVFILEKRELKHYVIPRDSVFILDLIKKEEEFWNDYVLTGQMPAPNGVEAEKDYVKNLPIDEVVELTPELEELIEQEQEIDSKVKELTKQLDQYKNTIIIKLAENSTGFANAEKVTATGGRFKLTYNTQVRKSLDSNAIKADGLYDRYTKESVSKVLRISQAK